MSEVLLFAAAILVANYLAMNEIAYYFAHEEIELWPNDGAFVASVSLILSYSLTNNAEDFCTHVELELGKLWADDELLDPCVSLVGKRSVSRSSDISGQCTLTWREN